jgi:hypothetical protein
LANKGKCFLPIPVEEDWARKETGVSDFLAFTFGGKEILAILTDEWLGTWHRGDRQLKSPPPQETTMRELKGVEVRVVQGSAKAIEEDASRGTKVRFRK